MRHALALGAAVLLLASCGENAPRDVGGASSREPIPERPGEFQGVGVALTGQAIRADQATVPAGRIVFSVANAGRATYVLVVEGAGMDARTEPIAPGGTARLDAQLAPGSYSLRTIPEQAAPVPGTPPTTLVVTPP